MSFVYTCILHLIVWQQQVRQIEIKGADIATRQKNAHLLKQ